MDDCVDRHSCEQTFSFPLAQTRDSSRFCNKNGIAVGDDWRLVPLDDWVRGTALSPNIIKRKRDHGGGGIPVENDL